MFQFGGFPAYTYFIQCTLYGSSPYGFPHSEIRGSKVICTYPRLIAACHVLLRLLMPRHSPCALLRLNSFCASSRIHLFRFSRLNCCFTFTVTSGKIVPNFTERPDLVFLFHFTCSCSFLYSVFNELSLAKAEEVSPRLLRVRLDLSSRAVSRQVLSALRSLTSVFGMGTGVPCASVRRTFRTTRLRRCLAIALSSRRSVLRSRLFAVVLGFQ